MKHIYLSFKERLSGSKSTFLISLLIFTSIFFSSNLFAQTEELPINSAWLSPDIKNPNFITGKNVATSHLKNVVTSNFLRTAPTATANPNIPQTLLCSDLKVVFVLDESGSIGASEATSVRQGATALANALLNSGATLQLVEFNTTASTINLGTTLVNSTFITNLNAYLGAGYGGKNYNPVSSGSCVGWTNWEDALDQVSGIDADLVIFFTDGNPTAYNVVSGGNCDGGLVEAGVTNGESLNQAIEKANAVKAQGKHMFIVGVGPDSEINLDNIKSISGNDLFGGSNNVLTADYTRLPFTQLASDLQSAVNAICGTTLTINKTASQPGVCANQFVELTTTLTNTGGDYNFDANNVVLTDVYPNGYSNLSIVSPISGANISGNTVTYNVGTMVSGASVSLVIRAKVLAPSNSRTFKNLVTATAYNANTVKDSVSVNSGISINQIDTSNCVPISINGIEYSTTGNYSQTFDNASAAGCDSVLSINFTLVNPTQNSVTKNECDSYTWDVNGETYTSSGTYSVVNGCHTELLNLTITPSSSNENTKTSCDSYTWEVNGETYTNSGSYTSVLSCHTEILNLTIVPSSNNSTTQSSCDSYTWDVNGATYTTSGSYTSVNNCRTETLQLTIIPSSSNTTTQSSCDSYTWDVNGETYTSSGSYTSVDGCHSEILQLTITPSTKTIYTESACGSYTWGINGVTYTTSGNYVSVNGCHTDSLYLTVTYNTTSDTSANVCNSFTWYGTTYTTSGDKTYVSQTGAGCTNTATLHLTIRLAPTVGIITGPTLVCKNKTGIVYSVPASVGATSYTWTLPTGMTGSSTTNTITVATGSTFCNGVIKVTANNDCGNSTAAQLSLTAITAVPASPTTITGTTSFCTAGVYTYTVANVAKATDYIWSVSGTGLSITSGQNTNTITVTVTSSFTCGSISVKASNCFGLSCSAKSISITKTAIPTKPSSICGPSTNVCKGANLVYSVTAVSNVTYTWTVPTGATITSGQGTNSIKVTYSPTFVGSGNISVTATNACGTSAATTLTVSALLAQPGAISGSVSCTRSQSSVQFSISAVSGATSYIWTVSGGAIIVGSTTGTSVKINFKTATSSSIVISVKAVNACGTSAATTKTVTVNLTSRNSVNTTEDAIAESLTESMIYPNPSKGLFNFNFNTQESDKVSVKIVDVNGRIVYQSVKSYSFGNQLTKIDISSMKKGTYFLHFTRNNKLEKTLPISIQ